MSMLVVCPRKTGGPAKTIEKRSPNTNINMIHKMLFLLIKISFLFDFEISFIITKVISSLYVLVKNNITLLIKPDSSNKISNDSSFVTVANLMPEI